MGFSQSEIEQVRERTDIVEVVSDYVRLKKVGRNFVGLCPFHSEKTPSFSVSREKQMYYCFGCGEGGTVFNFLMKLESLGFPEAVEELARRAGIKLTRREDTPGQKKVRQEKELLFQINTQARDFYIRSLAGPGGKATREYIRTRGISDTSSQSFSLGYAPGGGSSLRDYLSGQRMNLALAEKLGLVFITQGRRSIDRFRDRLVFPIEDTRGRVLGFGGRLIREPSGEVSSDKNEPKYVNSSDSPIFQKGKHLYGLPQARAAVRKEKKVILVEGYFDVISLYQEGISCTLAPLGTALTRDQVGILKNMGEKVIAIFDGDDAGRRAAWRALGLFLEGGVAAEGVLLPIGLDPDTFVRARGAEQLQNMIDRSESLLSLYIREQEAQNGKSAPGRLKTLDQSLPFIIQITDPVLRSLYLKEVSERIGVEEKIVRQRAESMRLRSHSRLDGTEKVLEMERTEAVSPHQLPPLETVLMSIMLCDPLPVLKLEEEAGECFSHPGMAELSAKIRELFQSGKRIDLAVLTDTVDDREIRSWLSAGAVEDRGMEDFSVAERERIVRDCYRRIQLVKLTERQKIISGRIAEAERTGNEEDIRRLLSEKQGLLIKKRSIEKEMNQKGGSYYA